MLASFDDPICRERGVCPTSSYVKKQAEALWVDFRFYNISTRAVAKVATLEAFITVGALTMDPSTQQVVVFSSR